MNIKEKPFSIEAEQSVLGAIILEQNCLPKVINIIKSPVDFYEPKHQKIYSTILELFSVGAKIDFVTVLNNIKSENNEDKRSIRNYMLELVQVLPSISAVSEYANIVKSKSKSRQLINIANDMLDKIYNEENVNKIADYASKKIFEVNYDDNLNASISAQDAALQSVDFEPSISTGFDSLDNVLKIKKNNLVLIAARPGMGKTSFALKLASNMSINKKVLFFSLEMSSQQLAGRWLSIESGIPTENIRSGNLSPDQWYSLKNTSDHISDANLILDDNPNMTVNSMKAKAHLIKNVDVVLIDYLQLMHDNSFKHDNRTQEISYITRNLKLMAKELDIPVICLSQLSRLPEQRVDHRPVISDLRDSGSIEQDADAILMLYRPGYYSNDEKIDPNECECIIAKNRFGALSTVKFDWNSDCTRFSELGVSSLQ